MATKSSKFVVNAAMARIDELAKLREKISALREREQELTVALRDKLESRKAGATLHGYHVDVALSTYTMSVLNAKKLEKFLAPEQIAKCYKKTKVTKLVITSHAQ